MVNKKTWEEFRSSKMLWVTNRVLHMFGWAIVTEIDMDSGKVFNCYPARVKFRGFTERSETEGFIGLSEYMAENAETLLKEAKE
tara:strand:- start:24817 stop:25068 length:252 start_codon:yes stop_codon:yes gene_type:complete